MSKLANRRWNGSLTVILAVVLAFCWHFGREMRGSNPFVWKDLIAKADAHWQRLVIRVSHPWLVSSQPPEEPSVVFVGLQDETIYGQWPPGPLSMAVLVERIRREDPSLLILSDPLHWENDSDDAISALRQRLMTHQRLVFGVKTGGKLSPASLLQPWKEVSPEQKIGASLSSETHVDASHPRLRVFGVGGLWDPSTLEKSLAPFFQIENALYPSVGLEAFLMAKNLPLSSLAMEDGTAPLISVAGQYWLKPDMRPVWSEKWIQKREAESFLDELTLTGSRSGISTENKVVVVGWDREVDRHALPGFSQKMSSGELISMWIAQWLALPRIQSAGKWGEYLGASIMFLITFLGTHIWGSSGKARLGWLFGALIFFAIASVALMVTLHLWMSPWLTLVMMILGMVGHGRGGRLERQAQQEGSQAGQEPEKCKEPKVAACPRNEKNTVSNERVPPPVKDKNHVKVKTPHKVRYQKKRPR